MMADPDEEKSLPSLSAFVEQTAKLLRSAASSVSKKNRKYSKETLGNTNKIEQLAKFLRSKVKKKKKS